MLFFRQYEFFLWFLACFCVWDKAGHVPAACTRLKKMQATACVKIGWPNPQMAVLSSFPYSFFCHLRAAEQGFGNNFFAVAAHLHRLISTASDL